MIADIKASQIGLDRSPSVNFIQPCGTV